MDFQQVIMRLNEFWADHGCLVWQPYNVQVGAGTMNPATVLRVLGPEPWNVAYLEPSVRPADGRYGENPNRWSEFYQYQVILKPDPGNPQELYLDSLRALGIDTTVDDVRFVEDNWESPALGAWGLGWEVWLNGQEISQYTYFQQAGGLNLDPVSVEITYGLERIVMALQGVREFPQIRWIGDITYGDIRLRGEVEHCTYNFEVADVENLRAMYDLCEAEAKNALVQGLAIPAHDYVLKCSHVFNVLDARGAVGVTERARYFVRMRDLAREVSALFVQQREEQEYPLMGKGSVVPPPQGALPAPTQPSSEGTYDFLLEIGSEELPVGDLDSGLDQLQTALRGALDNARLAYKALTVMGTPRRMVARVEGLDARQVDRERVVKGPPARIAFDDEGNPSRAAQGFARSQGVDVDALERRTLDGKDYVVAVVLDEGRGSSAVLAEALPDVVRSMTYGRSMRWNASGISYSRPLRWFVALLDDVIVPFEYAGVRSGRVSRGIRPQNCPNISIDRASDYGQAMADANIVLDVAAREAAILSRAGELAAEVGGVVPEDADLLREVANLVEYPLPIRGDFDESFLRLPDQVLLAVMRKHQRYLPVERDGVLLPHFIAVANGALDEDSVRNGNQEVLRARYADAVFFYDADRQAPLADYTPKLSTLMFQEQLGSVLDKVERLNKLVPELCGMLGMSAQETATATRAAAICKSDLATQLVVELTSLQGIMGRHYAQLSGESEAIAQAIEEHYLPRSMGDRLPESMAGAAIAIADRLDTLVGLFAVGVRPSGAADPWGLRRAALGLVHTLVSKGISLALPEALSVTAELLPVSVEEDALREVMIFINRRYRGYLLDQGYRYDMVDAALAEQDYDPFKALQTLQALVPWTEREGWGELLDTYARCVRITRKEEQVYGVDVALLKEPAARGLYDAYVEAEKTLGVDRAVDTLFQVLTDLKPAIRRFFDDILVMDEDLDVRHTRLGLLQAIGLLAEGILDLSVMEGF